MSRALIVVTHVLAAVLGVALLSGCGDGPVAVEYVVPDGYRGYFWVIVDPANGRDPDVRGGKVVVKVPQTGILRIRTGAFLSQEHTTTARDYSGKHIKAPGDDIQAGEIALLPLSTSAEGVSTYVVGTTQEVRKFVHDGGREATRLLAARLSEERK